MIKNIVHIGYFPLTNSLVDALFINHSIKDGFNTTWIDVAEIFNFPPNVHLCQSSINILNVRTAIELENYLLFFDRSDTLVNIQFYFEFRFTEVFSILSKLKYANVSTFAFGGLPPQKVISPNQILKYLNIKKILRYIYQNLITRYRIINKKIRLPEIIFRVGTASLPPTSENFKSFPINHFDYDITFRRSNIRAPLHRDCIIFLDINFTDHPDYNFVGVKFTDDEKEEYQKNMINLFQHLENQYKTPVVIAAHPKSSYQQTHFGGRKIIKNKTCELVKNCLFVLSHHSTSFSYAIIFNKPIVFIYNTVVLKKSKKLFPIFDYIESFAKFTDSPIFNTSIELEQVAYRDINPIRYSEYIEHFLASADLLNKDSSVYFIDYLKRL